MKKNLNIIYTSDTHGHIYPTDYKSREVLDMGLLKIINDFEKDENTLVIDGGDTIQGSPLVNTMWKDENKCIVGDVLSTGGYDYYTLGNHDFNYGYSNLTQYVKSMKAKCLLANVIDNTEELEFIPYDIKTMKSGLRVGVVGITTDHISVWEKPEHLENFTLLNAFDEAKKALNEIKEKCDFTICVYHGGFEASLTTGETLSDTGENVGYKLCKELDFDLLLTAHQHMHLELTDVFGTKVIQLSPNAVEYAKIEVASDELGHHITASIKSPKQDAHKKLYDKYKEVENHIQNYLDEALGELSEDIEALPKLEIGLHGSRMADLVNQFVLGYTNADIACLGLANGLVGLKRHLSIRDILIAFPYSNTLVELEVTGKILKMSLERCAEYFDVKENEICISDRFLIPKVEHYNYDFFSCITYTFDISQPLHSRVVHLSKDGKEIKDEDVFSLVMSDYRATGTGGYPFYKDCKRRKIYGEDVQALLLDYIRNEKVVDIKLHSDYKVIK